MEIQRTNSPAFTAKFVNNQSFKNVVKYAEENNMLRTLDASLNNLKKTNYGNITIIDGVSPQGKIYSSFMVGKKSVPNATTDAKTPVEASFDGIIELGMLGKKFRSLFGKEVKQYISAESITKEYTV